GGPPPRDAEVECADEKRKGKKLRFLPVAEVIPARPTSEDVPATEEKKDKGKGSERQRARSHSSHISSGHCTGDDWGMHGLSSVAGVTAGRRASSISWENWDLAWPKERRAMAHWIKKGEDPVLFFGAGSWIGRVRNRSETRSGSAMEGRALGERDVAEAV
ncbi:hypothetical protein V492_06508, partial [Pseudogymnoascus sp. VKM F-4246]